LYLKRLLAPGTAATNTSALAGISASEASAELLPMEDEGHAALQLLPHPAAGAATAPAAAAGASAHAAQAESEEGEEEGEEEGDMQDDDGGKKEAERERLRLRRKYGVWSRKYTLVAQGLIH
jgi:hypothetical protein